MSVQRESAALTSRGQRTRQALIEAAIEVFSEEGYFSSRLSAITERVGCSTGTLYTYFANRQEILAAIIEDSYAPVLAAERAEHDPVSPQSTPAAAIAGIRQATLTYVRRYRDNVRVVALMEQVASVDPEIRDLRVARAQAFYRRNARGIAALQQAGLVRSELDPLLTAKALSAMVSRTCRGVYLDEPDAAYATEEGAAQLADALTALWTGALGLRA